MEINRMLGTEEAVVVGMEEGLARLEFRPPPRPPKPSPTGHHPPEHSASLVLVPVKLFAD